MMLVVLGLTVTSSWGNGHATIWPACSRHSPSSATRSRSSSATFPITLVNAYLAGGGRARGIRAGEAYVDVGTRQGYRGALTMLAEHGVDGEASKAVNA